MPSGYTAKLYEGEPQTFPEFALACARNCGALIPMRDAPPDAEIPDRFEPSSYHADRLADAIAQRDRFTTMTDEEAQAEAAAQFEADLAYFEEQKAKNAELRGRYEAMLAEVETWEPPTKDHQGLKTFMADQLNESIRFDIAEPRVPVLMTGTAWRANGLAKAERDIEYHTAEMAKEAERAEGRTAWVRALRASLPAAEVTV